MSTGSIFIMIAIGSILIAEHLKSEKYEYNNYDRVPNGKNTTATLEHPQLLDDGKYTSNVIQWRDCLEIPLRGSTRAQKNYPGVNCPKGFTFHEDAIGTPLCYILTKKQKFPPKCPYSNDMQDYHKEIYILFRNESIWVKATRNLENQFGEFEWLSYSSRYLDITKYYVQPNNTVYGKNCMIIQNCNLYAVPCTEEHRFLCIYSYDKDSMSKFCTKRNNFVDCIATSFAMDNKCYCKATTKGVRITRDAFCEKFAEPDPFQNNVILKYLTNNSPCFIGIEQNNGKPHWSSSNQRVEYTNWKPNVNFSKLYGALDYDNPTGWILTDENSLECAICHKEVPYRNVTIHLHQIKNTNIIEIRINNVFDIHYYSKFAYVFVCFTDSDSSTMKKQVRSHIFDISLSDSEYMTAIEVSHHYPAYYWCETVQRPNLSRVFSNKILARKPGGLHKHEYSLLVEAPILSGVDPYIRELHVEVAQLIKYKLARLNFIDIVRPIKITKLCEETHTLNLLLHISSTQNNLPSQMEYDAILTRLKLIPIDLPYAVNEIVDFSRSEVCLEKVTVSGNITLTWPESGIGVTALPKELCLDENSLPVTRKCEGNFTFGAKWSKIEGECVNKNLSNTTLALYSMLYSETNQNKTVEQLLNLTNNARSIDAVVDVHFVSEIIQRLRDFREINYTKIAIIISNAMSFERNVVNRAQYQLNSTDIALNALDTILEKVIPEKDQHVIKSDKLIVYVSKLTLSNMQGVALRKSTNVSDDNFSAYDTIPVYNSSVEEMVNGNIEVAVLLSASLIDEILRCEFSNEYETVKVIISFFYNDVLFNDPYKEKKSNTTIVANVVIPSLRCELRNSFFLIFKSDRKDCDSKCVHWNYGVNEQNENIHGNWKLDSEPQIKSGKHTYAVCHIRHLTHFSVLVTTRNFRVEQTPQVNLALNIITSIGCGLSLIGLLGIFLIGIFYKSWRKRKRNIIMLNFSAALAAQMILFFMSDLIKGNSTACIVIGASLHYTVIASFGWMLIVAILQYRRFVLVYERAIHCLILKSLIVGWCMPLILVLVCLTLFPESYNRNKNGICYPDGIHLYCAVAVPIFIFVLINLFVFVKILLNVCNSKIERYGGDRNEVRLQVSFAILLFFLLGMSWIFGLGVTFTNNTVLSFIFCITATLQGFVVFICFILMNKQSRVFWVNIKKIIICAQIRSKS